MYQQQQIQEPSWLFLNDDNSYKQLLVATCYEQFVFNDYDATIDICSPSNSFDTSWSSLPDDIEQAYYYIDSFLLFQQQQQVTTPSTKKKQPKSKPFACHLCPRLFTRKHDLHRHIRVHTGAKPYSCLHCTKSFARTDALKRHLRVEESCRTSPIIQAMKEKGSRRYRNL